MSTITPTQPVPRKSRRRYYLAGFLLLLVTTAVSFYFVAGWMQNRDLEATFRELDADDPNWRWNDLIAEAPAPPPDDRNAAVQVLKVHALLKGTPLVIVWKLPKDPFRNSRLSAETEKLLRSSLSTLGPTVVEDARKLKDLPEGQFPMAALDNLPKERSSLNPDIVEVMRLLQYDALLRVHEGKTEEATGSCQAILNATFALDGYPAFMAFLIRMAGRELALDTVERTLAKGVVSRDRLGILQAALQREADSHSLYHALRGERAFRHEFHLLIKAGKVAHSEMLGGLNTRVPDRFYDLFPSLLLRSYSEDLRLQTEQVHASKLRDVARMEALSLVEQKMKKNADILTPFTLQYALVLAENERSIQAQLRCAITAVAAERYRLERGDWPRGADDLVKARMLTEVLQDPYDGQPLRWKRTTTGLVLHSVGPDKIDHGGKLTRGTAAAAGANWGFELWAPTFRGVPAPAEAEK